MDMYHDIDNLHDDPKLAEALGNMMIAWANAETALVFALSLITGMDSNMALMGYYRIPTFEARTKVLRALIQEWNPKKHDKDAIFRAITKLNNLARARNDWVHGVWTINRRTKEIAIFDMRAPEDKGRRKPVKAADVQNHVETVRKRTRELRALLEGQP
jgi:hypothetical protein